MENTALKLDFFSEREQPLFAFPRSFHHLENPAFVVEDHEVARLAFQMPTIKALPYTLFIDDQERVHFEINHSSFFPDRSWKTLFNYVVRPDQTFYNVLRTHIIQGSLLASERRLIGGMVCTYYGEEQTSEVKILGMLSAKDSQHVDPGIRRRAFDTLCERHRPFLKWLGAKAAYSTPCVVPVLKASKVGWDLKKLSFRENIQKFRDGFPMSLVKTQNIFFDRVYEEKYRDNSR